MAITKTNFINYTRCPRYIALDEIHQEKLLADISYEDYQKEEQNEKLAELIGGMYETDNEEEHDLIDKENRYLEVMMPYYKEVENLVGKYVKKHFKGNTIYSNDNFSQECFDFTDKGIKYLCYVDVYNENEKEINIIEVKATTTNKFLSLASNHPKQDKYSIFLKKNNILYLKDEIDGYNIEEEMPIEKYQKQKEKLFDRYKEGKYVFDLAVQRFIIEGEYKQSNNLDKTKNIHYYLGVLNHEYVFDGTYKDGKQVFNKDENGNEIVTLIDLTKVTEKYQEYIIEQKKLLEKYINNMDASPCKLGNFCEYKKQTQCKYFDAICGKIIPTKNSALAYKRNGFGFKDKNGIRHKGLNLINEGFINMLDIPEEWITSNNHHIQRDCLVSKNEYINKEKIEVMLKQIEYPIYHLDFETFPCPIPRFKGETPYIQSPFEFSLHIEREPGVCDKFKDNYVFLAKNHEDCREEMIKAMLKYMDPDKGTLFAQNVPFEKGRIKELANIFPQYKVPLMKLYDRGFDLLWLLDTNSAIYEELGYSKEEAKTMNFYDYHQSGSFSIKKTLPVFTDLTYDDMEVRNGTMAIIEYASYPYMSKEEFNLKYQALIDYCQQDTWAMVAILDSLRKKVVKQKI